MRRKGPVGRANQSPADKKQKQNLAGSLVVFSCPLDLAQSLCFCLFSRVSLSLSLRVCMCVCATCHCCCVKQESGRRRDWGCGLVCRSAGAGNPRPAKCTSLICEGGTVGGR